VRFRRGLTPMCEPPGFSVAVVKADVIRASRHRCFPSVGDENYLLPGSAQNGAMWAKRILAEQQTFKAEVVAVQSGTTGTSVRV
jgi:hypothetical protein